MDLALVLSLIFLISLPLPETLGFKTLEQYLPWHTVAEFFSIAVAFMVFTLGYSTATQTRTGNFVIIAVAFCVVGVLDLFHALSYPGMPAFITENSTNKAIYFWLAARGTLAVVLLAVAWRNWDSEWIRRQRHRLLGVALLWPLLMTTLVFGFEAFMPAMYVADEGLTVHKNGAEIGIALLYGLTAWRLWRDRTALAEFNVNWLAAAVWVMALSELYFTRYVTISDFFNFMGHLYKLAAYALAGYALFVSTVREPHQRLAESQARLQENEARLGAVVNSAMDAVIVADESQRVVFYNRVAERIFGWPIETMLGQPIEKLIPESFRVRHRDWVRQFAETGTSARPMGKYGRISGVRANGASFPAEAAIARITASGQRYFCITLRDITERINTHTALAQGETRYQTLVANIPGAVYRCELGMPWRASFISDGVLELTGYSAEMFLSQSRNWVDIVVPEDLPMIDAAAQAGIEEHRPYEIRYRIRHRDRGVRWVQENGTPMFDADGTPQWLDGVIFDITAQKAAEAALQQTNEQLEQRVQERSREVYESNQRLMEAQRIAHLGAWELDLISNRLSWSEEIFRIFEIDPERFGASYEAFLEAIHPDDRERVHRAYSESVANRTPYELVHRLRMPDGRIKHVRERGETQYAADGTARRSLGTVQDISVQMLAEASLRNSHALLDAVFDTTHVLIAVLDAELNFIRVNRAYAAADGKPPEFFPGKNHFALYPNADNEIRFRHAVRTGRPATVQAKPFEYALNPERGVTHWDWTLTPIPDHSGRTVTLVLSLLNVSERIHALEAVGRHEQELSELNRSLEERVRLRTGELVKAHEFTEAVLNTVGSLVVVLDRDGRIVRFNHTCERLTGYRAAEVQGRFVWDLLLADEEREPVKQVFARLRAGQFPNTHENYWVTREGEQRFIAWANTAITDEAGEVSYIIGTGTDVTERRRTEEALRQSENNFRQLAENIRETFFMRDLTSNRMLYVSPSYESLWGRSVEALLNDPLDFQKSIHPEDVSRVLAAHRRTYSDTDAIWFNEEYRIVQPDGSLRWVWVRTFPILDANKNPYRVAGLIQDITERKRAMDERLEYARAQRETLVREVHHRIKNNLQGVVGLLRQHAVREPVMRAAAETAVAQVGAMALVHGLQARDFGERVALCELTESIAKQVVNLTGTAIIPHVTRQVLKPVPLATDEAVPVALILNELLFNAVKHGAVEEPVTVAIDCEQGWAVIRIRNRARSLPAGLDIAGGQALGTGLSLVRALLPTEGASVALDQEGDFAVAELRLAPPWVELPEDCLKRH